MGIPYQLFDATSSNWYDSPIASLTILQDIHLMPVLGKYLGANIFMWFVELISKIMQPDTNIPREGVSSS